MVATRPELTHRNAAECPRRPGELGAAAPPPRVFAAPRHYSLTFPLRRLPPLYMILLIVLMACAGSCDASGTPQFEWDLISGAASSATTITDSSSHDAQATLHSASRTTRGVSLAGTSASFVELSGLYAIAGGTDDVKIGGDMSVEVWARWSGASAPLSQTLFSCAVSGYAEDVTIASTVTVTGQVELSWSVMTAATSETATTPNSANLKTDVWYHIVVISGSAGPGLMVYVNAQLVIENAVTGHTAQLFTPAACFIGKDAMATDVPFKGTVARLATYRGVLIAQQIMKQYAHFVDNMFSGWAGGGESCNDVCTKLGIELVGLGTMKCVASRNIAVFGGVPGPGQIALETANAGAVAPLECPLGYASVVPPGGTYLPAVTTGLPCQVAVEQRSANDTCAASTTGARRLCCCVPASEVQKIDPLYINDVLPLHRVRLAVSFSLVLSLSLSLSRNLSRTSADCSLPLLSLSLSLFLFSFRM